MRMIFFVMSGVLVVPLFSFGQNSIGDALKQVSEKLSPASSERK